MSEQQRKPWLTESIDFDTDIAPHQYIVIYAGVGSGKNTFVDKLVTGGEFKHADDSLVKPQNVLLISSRRAKIDEQLQLKDVVYDPAILYNSKSNREISPLSKAFEGNKIRCVTLKRNDIYEFRIRCCLELPKVVPI